MYANGGRGRIVGMNKINNVGAHNPTKIPNRSACAISSAVSPRINHQIAIDRKIDSIPN
jgi:hypothetical protein